MELGGVTEDTDPGTRIILIDDRGVPHVTFTRSVAWRLGSDRNPGQWVVKVQGRTGGYACSRCFVLPDDALAAPEP